MANRRMLSKTIVQTQRFLRLPLETQALYCYLVVNADDDGVVEAFPIMRMINANDDSLNLLVIKEYLLLLNSEMVFFIKDFFEQNTIKGDRYTPSKHRQLLIEYLKQNKMIESLNLGPRLVQYIQKTRFHIGTDLEPEGSHNIIKDKIDKDKIDKYKISQNKIDSDGCPILSKLTDEICLIESLWNRDLTEQERILLDKIVVDRSLLELAIQRTADLESKKQNISYLKGILMNWESRGLTTVKQIKDSDWNYKESDRKDIDVSEDFMIAMDIWKD